MKILLSNIKKLQQLAPDDAYRARSIALILGNPQLQKSLRARFFESVRYSVALSLTALVIVVAAGGFSYLNWSSASPLIIGSLNAKSIAAEAARVDAELELAQFGYYGASAQDVAVALKAVSQNAPDHLNDAVLNKELRELERQKDASKDIDALLNSVSM
ncbi:MAG: hypothetical protein Q7R85_02275 [bacterium]|nr:hypothetical protein [bacterium]